MIIQLKNFGPIEHFEFDTEKQMHFIFGENNIGKSYAISAVYLILKNWKQILHSEEFKFNSHLPEHTIIQKKIKTLKPEIYITDEVLSLSKRLLNQEFLPHLKKSLLNSFSSISELFNKNSRQPFQIIIKNELFTLEIDQKNNDLQIADFEYHIDWRLTQDNTDLTGYKFILPNNKISLYFYTNEEITIPSAYYEIMLKDILYFEDYFSSIFFLPASRSGIYNGLSAFSGIIVQLTQLRSQIPNLKFEIPNLSEPIADYFFNISNIKGKGYTTPFSQFAKQIEDNIIKGKVNFDKSNSKLYFEPANLDLSLELSQSSSMISEIAPIVAHLKFIFDSKENSRKNGDDFLFIEEPEAHLHPKIQVELIKLFAELAKQGLKIVMTSHSNYMFNKLSNMLLSREIRPENIDVAHMKMGEKGSYLDRESMKVDTEGIEDDNFSDVAEELYMERMKLYDQTH